MLSNKKQLSDHLYLQLWQPKICIIFFLPNPNIFLNPTKCFLCPKLKQIIDRKGKFNFDKSEVVSAFCRNVIMTFILEIVLSNVNN